MQMKARPLAKAKVPARLVLFFLCLFSLAIKDLPWPAPPIERAHAAPYGFKLPFKRAGEVKITDGPGEGAHTRTPGNDSSEAVDFELCNDNVYPTVSGKVKEINYLDPAKSKPNFGNYVVIEHTSNGNKISLYAHLKNISNEIKAAKANNLDVSPDTIIGQAGSSGVDTGCHLHFEIRESNGTAVRILDMSGIVANPAWNWNSEPRGFSNTFRQELFAGAYRRTEQSGASLGGPRPDNITICAPTCYGVPHFWKNDPSHELVVQNFDGPDGKEGGPGLPADDGIIAHREKLSGVPEGQHVLNQDGTSVNKAFVVRGGIWNVYAGKIGEGGVDGPYGPCGIPVSDEIDLGSGRKRSYFRTKPYDQDKGNLHWIEWDGTQIVLNCGPFQGPIGGPRGGPVDGIIPPPPSVNWYVEYFSDTNLGSRCYDGYETFSFIFKDWGDGSPAGGCPSNYWSARFSGRVHFRTGGYSFGVGADDWGRIKLNGNVIVNKWDGVGGPWRYEGYNLSEGDYDVVVEFADTEGSAKLAAVWWGPGFDLPRENRDPNRWFGQYWSYRDLWTDSITRRNEEGDFVFHDWGNGSPGWGLPADQFSARFEKSHYFSAGKYRFYMTVDDGGRVEIDEQLLISQENVIDYSADKDLAEGFHNLKFEYWENSGGASARLRWEQLSGPISVAFSSASETVNEGSGSKEVTVVLSASFSLPATVSYTTGNGTATASNDFITTGGSLSFAPLETSKTLVIPILEDILYEGEETLVVQLSSPNNVGLGANSIATLTILDNDPAPPPVVCVSLNTSTVDYGLVPISSSSASPQLTVTNCGSGPQNFLIQGAEAVAAVAGESHWTLGSAPGVNVYSHGFGDTSIGPFTALTTSLVNLATNVPVGGIKSFFTRLTTPTSTTGVGPRTTQITIVAVAP